MRRRTFENDRSNAKMMGVCAGLSNHTGIDTTLFRIGFVVTALLWSAPWTLLAYFLIGLAGRTRSTRPALGASERREAARMTDLDRRLAEIDEHVAHSNGRLAREIEELR